MVFRKEARNSRSRAELSPGSSTPSTTWASRDCGCRLMQRSTQGIAAVPRYLVVRWSELFSASSIRLTTSGTSFPMEEIALFLKDIEDGHYDGKPYLPIETQNLENATLRTSLKLDKKSSGVLVRKVYRLDSNFPLKVGDVVTKLGDHAVDNTGMVRIDGDRAVQYLYLVQRICRAGKLPVTVSREGREVHLDLPIDSDQRWVVRRYYEGASPYFIYGPLVFTEATNIYAQVSCRPPRGEKMVAIRSR